MEDPANAGTIAGHVVAALRTDPPGHEAAQLRPWAVRALRDAARRARLLHAPAEALAHLQDAIEIVDDDDVRAELWEEAAMAAESAARHDVAERLLRDAIDHHRGRRSPPSVLRRLTARLAGVLLMEYRVAEAVELLRDALPTLGAGTAASAAHGPPRAGS
jgi:hypothetical protein